MAEKAAPKPGARVLEIGCGTGAVTARLVERGAEVTALDQNPEMMDRAWVRLERARGSVTWLESIASEIDALAAGAFDAVVISLAPRHASRSPWLPSGKAAAASSPT